MEYFYNSQYLPSNVDSQGEVKITQSLFKQQSYFYVPSSFPCLHFLFSSQLSLSIRKHDKNTSTDTCCTASILNVWES